MGFSLEENGISGDIIASGILTGVSLVTSTGSKDVPTGDLLWAGTFKRYQLNLVGGFGF